MKNSGSIANLIGEFKKFPGIGQKTAERLVFFLLKEQKDVSRELAEAILNLKDKVQSCSKCNSITENDPCDICSNPKREQEILCVVEEPRDLYAIERMGEYRGRYYVLMGNISPLEGIGPEDIQVNGLVERVKKEGIQEVILATNPNMEGDATAIFISKTLKSLEVKVTRIARGLPVGSDLEYADEVTILRSFEGRMEI
ncbi:MAG TPA: recombination mediator RecR [Nitrospinota bacterium]|jgi:recombination protein RecR|nr:recombination mediator RecR [Nitrospinota bacterium]